MKTDLQKTKYFEIFQGIGNVADSLNYKCFVVGGFVRDLFLDKDNDDLDFVVEGSGLTMAKAVAKFFNTNKVSLYESYGTAKVDVNGIELEFVGARKEFYHRESRNPIVEDGTIQDDMDRRDLTINDIAICLNEDKFGEVFDPHNGLMDLKEGIIRTPLDPNITFSDDPLRMLRAIRFASRFDFEIEDSTFLALRENADRLKIITKERVCEEMEKMMKGPNPAKAFSLIQKSGLMKICIPEMQKLVGISVSNTGVSHKDIFLHTIKVLDFVAKQTDDEWTRWAALLHDIGKGPTKKWVCGKDAMEGKGKGQWTFENHASVGGNMIPKLFTKIGMPQDSRMEKVKTLVTLHMRPMQLCAEGISDSAIRRILFEAGDYIDDLMILCNADITSQNKDKVSKYRENYELLVKRMHEIEESDHLRNFQPPVDGNEIMEAFGLKPCKTVGILKEAVKNAILDGDIPNEHDAAFEYVKEQYYKLCV